MKSPENAALAAVPLQCTEVNQLVVSVPDDEIFSFTSQVNQYPKTGPRGIEYVTGQVKEFTVPVDCLIFRDKAGKVRGILNHYPVDMPPFEKAGNVNVYVDPKWQRKGIATKLLVHAETIWKINFAQQRYTAAGAAFAKSYLQARVKRVVSS